jgi:murein DD-endopeptidase MepM/ murein hydrolase activator NlpD
MKYQTWFAFILISFITGCSNHASAIATLTLIPSDTNTPLPPTETATPTAASVPLIDEVCSPLRGIALDDLWLITSNAYFFKYPFSEGSPNEKNHPGIDLGFYTTANIPSYTGQELHTDDDFPIQAILPGKIVETVNNRFPYGNMVLIETRVDALTPEFQNQLRLPEPYSREVLELRFPCDKDQPAISWSQDSKSIYVLYAHMKDPSTLQPGDQVQFGQVIGGIGATGNSSESIEHLHLEIRIGPSDAEFGFIASYDAAATTEERYNYCIWALSQEFQSIDPTFFWETAPDRDP